MDKDTLDRGMLAGTAVFVGLLGVAAYRASKSSEKLQDEESWRVLGFRSREHQMKVRAFDRSQVRLHDEGESDARALGALLVAAGHPEVTFKYLVPSPRSDSDIVQRARQVLQDEGYFDSDEDIFR